MNLPLLTIDLAHPPRHPGRVEEELLEAWGNVRNSSSLRVLKIVHGKGSATAGSRTKEVVRNWIFRHRKQFRLVIEGERYGITDSDTMELRGEVGLYIDTDLDAQNAGITVVWVH